MRLRAKPHTVAALIWLQGPSLDVEGHCEAIKHRRH